MEWRLGTIGFGYHDWAGVFYPADMKPAGYLSFYAQYFDTVELDTTFHGAPSAERVKRWADATPEHFRFAVKAPKEVTHATSPASIASRLAPMLRFVESVRGFGEKLGPVLLQLPPSFQAGGAANLARFLSALPEDVRFAVEFRHSSWHVRATMDMLRDCRCAWVSADYLEDPWYAVATTDFLYARWIGEHGRYPTLDRERIDTTERLKEWHERITRIDELHQMAGPEEIKTAWGFFNNDYAGYAVGTCNRMRRIAGLPVRAPEDSRQGLLFQ